MGIGSMVDREIRLILGAGKNRLSYVYFHGFIYPWLNTLYKIVWFL